MKDLSKILGLKLKKTLFCPKKGLKRPNLKKKIIIFGKKFFFQKIFNFIFLLFFICYESVVENFGLKSKKNTFLARKRPNLAPKIFFGKKFFFQ